MWVKHTKTYTRKYANEELDTTLTELLALFDRDEHRQAQAINTHWVSYYDEVVLYSIKETTASAEESALIQIEHTAVRQAIQRLNHIQKRRVVMYYFCDMTQETIAEIEGVSQPAVKASLDIALKKIKNHIEILILGL